MKRTVHRSDRESLAISAGRSTQRLARRRVRAVRLLMIWLLSVAAGLALPLVTSIPLLAQSSRGTIVGTVRDPSGSVIPETKVTVTNLGTNVAFEYLTDSTGDYYVPSLIPGRYRVEAEKSGFKRLTVAEVLVEVNQTVRVDVRMELGEVAETLEIHEASSLVQTDTTTLGQVVNNRQVTELPLNGRDFTNLLRLNVGVSELQGGITTAPTIRRHGLNDSFRNVSVNGARPASISFLIDGVNSNEGLFQAASNIPPIDAIQEFKLQNGLYSAEFGMGAAQVNLALKSGSNDLHGSLWEFLRNDALQAKHPRFHTKVPLKQNQFGGTVGGPLRLPWIYNGTDRTFFFGSYQGGRRRIGSIGQAQVPTDRQKQGDFSDWPVELYNPLTGMPNPGGTPAVIRQPFANNRIPTNLIAPQSQNLLKYFPSPNVECQLPCNNFVRSLVTSVTIDQFTARLDHNLSTSDRIFGQFLFQNEDAPAPTVIPLSGNKVTQKGRLVGLQWTHIFGPRTLNEVRAGFNRLYFLQGFETAFGSTNYWKEAGLTNLRDDPAYYALPAISLGTQYASLGNGGSVPFFNISNVYHLVENFSFTRGRHSMKAGVDFRRSQNMNQSGFGGNGFLNFQGSFTARNPVIPQTAGRPDTGNAFADFLLGYLNGAPAVRFSAFDQSFSRLRNSDYMFFFHDDFRLNSQLTLNLGIRYELHTPFKDISGGGSIFDFNYPGGRRLYRDKAFTELFNNPILAGCCAKDTLIDTDKTNWAPRFGLAWRPFANNNRFVVRAGYGIFYDVLQNYYPMQSVSQNVPFLSPTLSNPTGLESQPPLDIRSLFPAPYSIAERSFPPPYCQAPSREVVDPQTGIVRQVLNFCSGAQSQLPDNRTPYLQQWALNLQYELRPNLLLEVGYQGSHGLRLPIQWIFNQATLPPESGNVNHGVTFRSECPAGTYPDRCSPIQERVRYPNFIRNAFANANILQSVYHAMTVKVDKRFSEGLQMLGSFTWGRAIDQFSEIQAVGGSVSSIAQYGGQNFNLERGAANFDQTRRLVLSWNYELPVGKGKPLLSQGGLLNHLLGGWQVNGIATLADGTPFTVGCFCGDRSQTGNIFNTQRMNTTGNPLPSGFERTLTRQFDTSVFVTPALGTLGTSGRNTLRSTGQRSLDFSLFKNNRITESLNLQLRAEAFNLFASPYYFPVFPVNNATLTNFGSLLPVGGDKGNLYNPRIIQLALRLVF
jgi:hypothetical protein